MGRRFEQYKARHQGKEFREPIEECPITEVSDELHEIFHVLFEEDLSQEQWDRMIEHQKSIYDGFPEDFSDAEVGHCIYMMMEDFRDYILDEPSTQNEQEEK